MDNEQGTQQDRIFKNFKTEMRPRPQIFEIETFRDYKYFINLISCWNKKKITSMIIYHVF